MADTGTGATMTFASTSYSVPITQIVHQGESVDDIRTSHLGTTGGHTYIPSDLVEGGEYVCSYQVDPNEPPIDGAPSTETITYTAPIPSGSTVAATEAFTGYIKSHEKTVPTGDLMTGTFTVKVAGTITKTDAAG